MAALKHSPDQGKKINYVAQDRIWKAHIETEMETAKNWPANWGFLTTSHKELLKNEVEEKKKRVRLETPEHMRVRPVTPVEMYIKVAPSPAVPPTTQGLVGWRSTIPELQLERYGRSRYLKGDFFKQMNWPAEGMD
ncbi:ciliary microtubule inner protein 1 [Rhinophrynus dorsalis]